jgi:hypothetical protein
MIVYSFLSKLAPIKDRALPLINKSTLLTIDADPLDWCIVILVLAIGGDIPNAPFLSVIFSASNRLFAHELPRARYRSNDFAQKIDEISFTRIEVRWYLPVWG